LNYTRAFSAVGMNYIYLRQKSTAFSQNHLKKIKLFSTNQYPKI